MEELIKLANQLGGVSFATLLFLVLVGNRLRVWRWNQDFLEMENRYKAEIDREKNDRTKACDQLREDVEYWRGQTMRLLGVAETQATVLRVKETKERRRLEQP